MAHPGQNHDLARRRQFARASLVKRRSAIASVLGFVALFGLAAQHTVKGASARSAVQSSARTPESSTTFFDQRSDGFAFDDRGGGFVGSAVPPAPPVTQTSVS